MTRLHMTLVHEVDVLEHQFARNGVHTTIGAARFLGPHEIEVTPDNGDLRVVEIPRLPRSLAVIGGGVIGVEYATIFSALDVAVTLVESRPRFLEFVDHELIEDFIHQLRDRGMAIRFGSAVARIGFEPDRTVTTLENGRTIRADVILYAAGRLGATDTLNLGSCGIEPDERGRIKVDPHTFQTPAHLPDRSAAHLRGGRRDRVSEPGVDLDGARTDRRVPRSGPAHAAGAGILPLWHLRGAGNFHGGHERGRSAPPRHPL